MFSDKRYGKSLMFLQSPHLKSPMVTRLQLALQKRGFYHGQVDGEFGQLSYQAVYRAKYWLGYLKPNHVAGATLLAYLEGEQKPGAKMRATRALRVRKSKQVSPGTRLVNEALAHLGTKESPPGSNKVMFSHWYGMVGSWCAMFVSYVANKCGHSQFQPGKWVAYVPFLLAEARMGHRNLVIVHPSNLRDGDIPCYDWPGESPGVADHTGFVITDVTLRKHPVLFQQAIRAFGNKSTNQFWAVEGNTAVGADSDGGEVMIRLRNFSYVEGFVRITK